MRKRLIVPILGLLLTALAGCAGPGLASVPQPAEGNAPLNARQLPVATFADDAENTGDEGVSAVEVAGPPQVEPQGSASATPAAVSTARFFVPTITCPGCQARVAASARSVPGVVDVQISGRDAIVQYDPSNTTPEAIAAGIEKAGDVVVRQ